MAQRRGSTPSPTHLVFPHQLEQTWEPGPSDRQRGRATSFSDAIVAFPEPYVFRSTSERSTLRPGRFTHRSSRSDQGPSPPTMPVSTPESPFEDEVEDFRTEPTPTFDNLSEELSNLTLQSEEGLRRFQFGELASVDEDWHRLVPLEAREALGKKEVQRQCVIFEVFKSERDYVADLEAVKDVFIDPLLDAEPLIMSREDLHPFVSEVFYNLSAILARHQRMLAALFNRQREQHPLVQSVTDVILETTFLFINDYDSYIKHYPLAESRHRTELRRNQLYQTFIQERSADPRVRKRDLITFLSRPVTRLPRLSLILEQINKLTDDEHPDKEALPLLLGILSDFIKSTQPGIEAAESKVKFWDLCKSLEYAKGEIIEMDLYGDSRTMLFSSHLARRQKSDADGYGWADLFVALLDNFFIMTREEKQPDAPVRRRVVSRPIPLEYLCIASFNDAPVIRRERADDGRLLESLRSQQRQVYPFTVYHAVSKSTRRYTLYAPTEAVRKKWHDALVNALAVHKAMSEGNMWFVPRSFVDRVFTALGTKPLMGTIMEPTGRIISAARFVAGSGRRFLAVGCETGVYIAPRGDSNFQKVFSTPNPCAMDVLQTFNKFIVQFDQTIQSYSLDLLARFATGQVPREALDATMERIADGNAVFFRVGHVGKRTLLIYAVKSFWHVTLHTLEAIHPSEAPRMRHNPRTKSFRPFGQPITAPKDLHDVTPLAKTLTILGERNFVVVGPTNNEKSAAIIIPDLTLYPSHPPLALLKSRLDEAKPLGLVHVKDSEQGVELLLVYDGVGCYVTKHGTPSRNAGFIRWETKAMAFAQRGPHILLFSPEYIEVRLIKTGRLVQVIQGDELRLLHRSHLQDDGLILFTRRADVGGRVYDEMVELFETTEIAAAPPTSSVPGVWDDWVMTSGVRK